MPSSSLHLTLRQLRAFEAVARRGSFSRAAEELHLAQPTVSVQVRQVAQAVGVPLLEPSPQGLALTEAGALVAEAAREMSRSLERLETRLAELKGLERGRLKVSVVTTAKYFVPRLLGPFMKAHPGIDVALDVGNRAEIVNRLTRNDDDLYIMGVPPAGMDLVRVPFAENPIVAVAPVGHPLAGRRRLPLARLAEEPFMLRERGSGTRMACERFLKEHGLRLKVRMELGSNEAIKQAVAGGLGLSLLSLHALSAEARRGELAVLDVQHLPIRRSWYIVHRAGRPLSQAARSFFDYLQAEGVKLQAELRGTEPGLRSRPRRARGGPA
ncbi:MAG TPA: LysR family transcriptional regulator [Burkholderiales bacterium]|nr:LysR family transcriptional regulator [Burkholderiales bacterium]